MNKPTHEQIDAAWQLARSQGKTDAQFINAAIKKGWMTMDEIGNPEFGEDGMIIAPEETTEEGAEESSYVSETPKKELGSDNNYEILKNICDRYAEARKDKANLLDAFNGGEGLPKDSDKRKEFDKKLKEVNTVLEEIENGNELKEVFSSIKEVGFGDKWNKGFTPEMGQTLYQIKNKVGSSDNDAPFMVFGSPVSLDKFKAYSSIEDAMKEFDSKETKKSDGTKSNKDIKGDNITPAGRLKKINNSLKGISDEDESAETPKEESNKGKSSLFGPTKKSEIDIKKSTDEMAFGDDVAGVGGEEYVESRNNKLATALKLKGIKSKEDINKFLNQYPSWKNAKDEWKKKTLKSLVEKVGNIETEKEKKSIFNKDNLIKDDEGNTIGVKHIDIKKKNVGDDWTPSDDDSINGVEEDIFREDNLIKDKEGKTTGVKHISIKKKK